MLTSFKFAHMSDVHLDSWREPELKKLNLQAFETAIRACREQKVEFLLISGDLFHTAAPDYDIVATAAKQLKELKDSGTRIYVIPGSHDYSYSQKTILNVLENSGLFVNVVKGDVEEGKLKLRFTIDEKTGAKITGILGKKGQLEKGYYEALDRNNLERESGLKVFMFHSGIEEYKPKHLEKMECIPLSFFPKGFAYYAGGHIHHPFDADEAKAGYGKIVMPGAVYPVNFEELQRNETGHFMVNEAFFNQQASKWEVKTNRIRIEPKKVAFVSVDAENLSSSETEEKIKEKVKSLDLADKILLLKVSGTMKSGKPADIKWPDIDVIAKSKQVYAVKKNINQLMTKEFIEIKIESAADLKELEKKLIQEHLGKESINGTDLQKLAQDLIKALEIEKEDSETITTFENRILKAAGHLVRTGE